MNMPPLEEADENDKNKIEIPNPFMEAIARGDAKRLDAHISNRTRIWNRIKTIMDSNKRRRDATPTPDEEKLEKCIKDIVSQYISDDVEPSMGNLPRWCKSESGEPAVTIIKIGRSKTCENTSTYPTLEQLVNSWNN
jgi:hypothetical protein